MQACAMGMHSLAHSFCPAGQLAPHRCPSQVAVPPRGVEHDEHESPHDAGEALLTQAPPQRWYAAAQVIPQR
jgi:hypothetical protein